MTAKKTRFGAARASAWACLLALGIHAGQGSSAEPTVTQAPEDSAVKWFECGGPWPQKGCEAAVVWGDWERGASGWWVRAPKGHTFARHSHGSPERILLVRGRMVGGVDGSAELSVKPGMYWELSGNVVHWARCIDSCVMYITYDLPFDLHFP